MEDKIKKYVQLKQANITCIDYSYDMLEQAVQRFNAAGLTNIICQQGDVGSMTFKDNTFDYVLSMNGLHVFPDKPKAYSEIFRVLKSKGYFIGNFYVAGESKATDWLSKNIMARKGWFTPPFYNSEETQNILRNYCDEIDFHLEGPICYFKARKR